jgi:hypothetical protein
MLRQLFTDNFDKVNWDSLSGNTYPSAIDIPDKINWKRLSFNSSASAIGLLKNHPDKIDWIEFAMNSSEEAKGIVKQNLDKINDFSQIQLYDDWVNQTTWTPAMAKWPLSRIIGLNYSVCINSQLNDLIRQSDSPMNMEQLNRPDIDWSRLSASPTAILLLKEYPHNIDWTQLSKNWAAIELLMENQDKINWDWFSCNPAAIYYLEANQDKIRWRSVWENPAIFEDEPLSGLK